MGDPYFVDSDMTDDASWLLQADAASRKPYPSRDALAHHLRVAIHRLNYRTEHELVSIAAYAEAVVNLRVALRDVLQWVGCVSHDSSEAWDAYNRGKELLGTDSVRLEQVPLSDPRPAYE